MINWIVRYAKILNDNRDLFDPAFSVLEAGGGSFGIAQYLKRKVTVLEPAFLSPAHEWIEPAQGSVLNIPFADGSFDYVICADLLEQLPPADRPRAIAELIRITRRKLIISCACGHAAMTGEGHLLEFLNRFFIPVPDWLNQHLQTGLPNVSDILLALQSSGFAFTVSGNETVTQHYAGIILDFVFPLAGQHKESLAFRTSTMSPLTGAEWDQFYSYLFTIEKSAQPRTALNLEYRGDPAAGGQAQLYSVYHKEWPTSHLGRIIPIYAGAAAASAPHNALTDHPLGEPPLANSRWSELSAIYKIWRAGPRSAKIGFCHYRRFFNFAADPASPRETRITASEIAQHAGAFFDDAKLNRLPANAILCAAPFQSDISIWDFFITAHNTEDYCRLFTLVSARAPQLMSFLIEHHHVRALYANNMFVTNWLLFDELCMLWFGILREFEKTIPPGRGNTYQNRDISFLAERIFDAWIRYKKSLGVEIIEVPIFFIQD